MNICLPYTYLMNDLFRCLFHDLGIAFTPAPPPGKYTRQIGASFAGGTLCPGLEEALGSLVECRYLGADTALVFAPCGGCSAERIGAKLTNCLEANGNELRLITLTPEEASQKAFWKVLRAESGKNAFVFRESKRRFTECFALLCALLTAKERLLENETNKRYAEGVLREIGRAESLLDLKIVLSLYGKRLRVLAQQNTVPLPQASLPYAGGDYFHLGSRQMRQEQFFTPKKAAVMPPQAALKCAAGGDIALFLTAQK